MDGIIGKSTSMNRPIVNISKIDELRKTVGLEKLAEYIEIFKEPNGKEVKMPSGYQK